MAPLVSFHIAFLTGVFAAAAAGQAFVCDLESGLPGNAAVSGEVLVQREIVHGGENAVSLARGAELLIPVAEEDGFGTVTMWVYDSGLTLEGEAAKERAFGPLWGLSNTQDQRLCFGLIYAPYLSGNGSYGWISTAENGWSSRRYARSARTEGWRQWRFTVNNETDIVVTVDDREATGFDIMTSKFFRGFSGVYLRGSRDLDERLFVDDLEVSWQQQPLTERVLPLPGEKRPPPEAGPLPLKPHLVGKHPRLFFTAQDIPALLARCKSTHQDFFDRLLSGAESYLGQMPPSAAGQNSNDQDMQQWGWWRLQTLAFAYVVTGDERYGRKAIEWMEVFAAYEQWGTGQETNQSMGAANFLTGMACAYDWCHDLMSDDQRERFRDKLLWQLQEMCWAGFMDPTTAGYWKGDHQNNHRHHRLSGLLLASLALHGEVPEAEAYASFAAEDCRKVADAMPHDGSNHEGPSYTAYGFSYVVRCFDALRHCAGIDLFATTTGLRRIPYFRAHTLTPGFQGVFNFSDSGGSTYYFNHYLFKLAAEYQDGGAQALMDAAYRASPQSFIYHPWNILWYDAELEPVPLEQIPTWAYFDDLEVATYRSSWTDPDALAILFKCGPYGGHRLNELAEGWFNVAHDHPDANHFMIFWKGRMWATDDGYPKKHKGGENHNVVLVDGKGPLQRGTGWLQPIPNMAAMGRIDTVVHEDGLFAARGDATEYYPDLTAAFRWLAVVQDRYVVICDHLTADEPHEFQWLLHSDADWSQDEPACFSLTKGEQRLRLRFALPAGLVSSIEEDILEEKSRGHVLRVSPQEATGHACFIAVFAMEGLGDLRASEDTSEMTVSLGEGITLVFDVASGEVALR